MMNDSWLMNESRAKLARELLALLERDRREAQRWLNVRARLDAIDDFEAEEQSLIKDKAPPPVHNGRIGNRNRKLAMAQQKKRDNKRFTRPVLQVMIGYQNYKTVEWSLGGFLLKDYNDGAKISQRIPVTFCNFETGAPYFQANTRVIRIDARKCTLSLKLEILSEAGFNFLSGLQLQQLRQHRH